MSYYVLKYRGFYVSKRDKLLLTKDRKYAAKFNDDEYNDAFSCLWSFDKQGMVIRKVCFLGLLELTIKGWQPPKCILSNYRKNES